MSKEFWQNKKVFITGATGLVGSWLVKDLLAEGADPIVLVRDTDPQSEFYRSGDYLQTTIVNGSLEDFNILERAINQHEIEVVFHLAAQAIVSVAHRSPLQTFESNLRGSYNLLEACRQHAQIVKQVIIASSDKAYGTQTTLPYVETMPLQGKHPYEVSKTCTDLIAQSYYHTYGLPVSIARCGNIYGGADLNWSRIIPGTIRSLLNGERPIIRSDGTFIRDYIYVRDVTRAYMLLAEHTAKDAIAGEAFNFGPERPLTVLELVNLLRHLMNREDVLPDIQNTAQGEIHSQYLDSSKAEALLDWKLQYKLEDSLRKTIDWYTRFFEKN